VKLEELQRMLGGVVRQTRGQHWLETRIGGLRAAVIQRYTPHTKSQRLDVAVFAPATRELDPLHQHGDGWRLREQDELITLREGYVFGGCFNGILFATALVTPSAELVVATLWDLASHARKPWHPTNVASWEAWLAHERQMRRTTIFHRITFAALVFLLVWLVRR
jgi:hypothetical protein